MVYWFKCVYKNEKNEDLDALRHDNVPKDDCVH